MAYNFKLPKGKYILRVTPPLNYLKKHEGIKNLNYRNAQNWASEVSEDIKSEKGVIKEAQSYIELLKKRGGGFIVFHRIEPRRWKDAFLYKVQEEKK